MLLKRIEVQKQKIKKLCDKVTLEDHYKDHLKGDSLGGN